jgi:hypothetical protein
MKFSVECVSNLEIHLRLSAVITVIVVWMVKILFFMPELVHCASLLPMLVNICFGETIL